MDVEAAGVADEAQEARDVELRRLPEQRLPNRQPLQLNAETMFHRGQRLPGLEATTTRNCLCTLFRTRTT